MKTDHAPLTFSAKQQVRPSRGKSITNSDHKVDHGDRGLHKNRWSRVSHTDHETDREHAFTITRAYGIGP